MIDWKRVVVFRGLAAASVLSFVVHAADETLAQWILLLALVAAGPLFIHWCAEPALLDSSDEALDPSTKPAWLVAMFAPGSGRTAVLLVVSLAMVLASFLVVRMIWVRDQPLWGSDDPVQLAMVVCYALVYVLVPSTLLAPLSRSPRGSSVVRLVCVGLFVVPALLAARTTLAPSGHELGDPLSMLRAVHRDGSLAPDVADDLRWLVEVAGFALVVSLPRMINGVREVVRITRDR